MSRIALEDSWKQALESEFEQPYMKSLKQFLKTELDQKKIIYPKPTQYFAALDMTPLDQVRVVILGQDPYHGPGQAHGLSFSVQEGVRFPPSLQNIFKEIRSDLGLEPPETGDLTPWALQGVLLLNATLSVEARQAGSHQNRGWETFTDKVVEVINDQCENVVFMLWGSYAQKKGSRIDRARHYVLQAPHPSPLSAHRGFFGCRHFSKANEYLENHGKTPVTWAESPSAELRV